jgi:hypothetical protein
MLSGLLTDSRSLLPRQPNHGPEDRSSSLLRIVLFVGA